MLRDVNYVNAESMSVEAIPGVKRELVVLYLSMLASRVGFGVIIIIFPSYISGASDIAVAGALALYPLMEAATALPAGRLCDTRGRKTIFIASLGFMALLIGLIGLTRNIYAVASIHAVMGVGAAGVTVSTLTMVTDLTGKSNRGAGMGTFDFANVGGYALGLVLGSRLEPFFSWSLGLAFIVTGLGVAMAFAVSALIIKEPPHPQGVVSKSLNPLKALDARAKTTLPIWLGVTALLGMVFFLPRAFSRAGIGGASTAGLLVVGVVILGLGAIGFGALSDRIGRGKVMLIGIFGLLGLLIALSLSFGEGLLSVMRNLLVLGPLALMTSALVPTILATVGDGAMLERRGSAMGLYSVMLSGGSAVGTLVAGFAHSAGGLAGIFEASALIFSVACALSLILWLRIRGNVP
jgi:MFS family permease